MKKAKYYSVIILFTTIISHLLLYSCTEEFDYGKSENAVKTLEYSDILQTTAIVSGTVNTDNGASLTARGICYSINNNPTISGPKKPDTQAALGGFTCTLTNLYPSTTYFARAYATNSYGTAYGGEITFTTQKATIPILASTTAAFSITQISANSGGDIIHTGISSVTSRGVCFSKTNAIPTISDSKTNDGTGIGKYNSSMTSLTPNTLYYIRAYATNSVGTAYADVKSFTTTAATIPVVSTTTVGSFITQTTAISGGNVTSESGATVTSRGVCWSNLTSTPTITNSKTIDGAGSGTFTSSLTGLVANTTYYVRAYATNSIGTAYGSAISVRTLSATLPTGITTSGVSVGNTIATSNSSVSNDGGSSITSRGVCWSDTTTSPTTLNSRTVDGSGTGSFSSSLTNLTPGTTYYLRAYAINSVGTSYGTVFTFNTVALTVPSGITTSSASSITQTTASSGGSISNGGGATITAKGVCWSNTTSSPTIFNSSTNNGSGTVDFSSSLTGLTANTTYYVRAYATNSVGTSYGAAISFTTLAPTPVVGQSYQGGIVAYIFQSGDSGYIAGETHGLIATTSNQTTGSQWGCSGTSISTSLTFGTGQTNTTSIVNGCTTSSIAARICNDLVSGGYSDWYLPSYYDLEKLYINRTLIGGFSNTNYWSSSQSGTTTAYSLNFSTGAGVNTSKTSAIYVRAIRKF